jgi:hypothetical protein
MAERPLGPVPGSYWVEPGRFAAGGYPGHPDPAAARERLGAIRAAGIDFFLDLTQRGEWGLPSYEPELDGAGYRRIPIRDMGVPSVETMGEILDEVDGAIAGGRAVYLHCYGGVGLTGTAVGCWLVRHGSDWEEALRLMTGWRRRTTNAYLRSPQTYEQHEFVARWAERDPRGAT